MGGVWLHNLVQPLAKAFGNKLELWPGYELRSRSSGGFDEVCGIVIHHDTDPPSSSDYYSTRYIYDNAATRPIGNFHIHRNGTVIFGAAGASNHAGKGGPVSTSKGIVPLHYGNRRLIGIEASNDGVGEIWKQLESYLTLLNVICRVYNLNPLTDIFNHQTYAPNRKIDPYGPTPGYKFGPVTWKINEVRKEVNARLHTNVPTPTVPPTQYYVQPGDSWWSISRKFGMTMAELVALNPPKTINTVLHPNNVLNVQQKAANDMINWNVTSATTGPVTSMPPVVDVYANKADNWAVIALIKAVQRKAGLPVTGKHDQKTGEAVNRFIQGN